MTGKLHLIVEGDGDKTAVPKLVHKILADKQLSHVRLTGEPQVSGGIAKVEKRLADFLGYALKHQCPILWVLDCDEKIPGKTLCPVEQVAKLKAQIAQLALHNPQPIEFAFFIKEFEALFLLEEQALRTHFKLAPTVTIDPKVALRRDAKGEISALLGKERAYKETTDQAKITSLLSLDKCREVSRDFRHLESAVLRLCTTP
ncbi:DUF4276 family protein [Curvibacter sp. CHRR-16]|uniref:DUF4276 family protein n=1 Tax=Curvibacter sp. CHRR-16 TaxID=2835872 RepID=UPI001BDAA867|nr:DUF4276 family protein [Curvibacter sp. CHRR-16]MBT0569023.1 DUF4276 family protein [Curvibacter sp. CHRR-16]